MRSIALQSNLQPLLCPLFRSRYGPAYSSCRQQSSTSLSGSDIDGLLAQPSWSVKSLLDGHSSKNQPATVTREQLRHLLRLSALPPPDDGQGEAKMLQTLESQLQFVQAIQSVDCEKVRPLQSIRDETEQAGRETEITMKTLQAEFDKEEVVGFAKRIKRKKTPMDTKGVEDWDPLALAPNKFGRFIVAKAGKP